MNTSTRNHAVALLSKRLWIYTITRDTTRVASLIWRLSIQAMPNLALLAPEPPASTPELGQRTTRSVELLPRSHNSAEHCCVGAVERWRKCQPWEWPIAANFDAGQAGALQDPVVTAPAEPAFVIRRSELTASLLQAQCRLALQCPIA